MNCHKHLGLYLTSNLDWSEQVHQVCLKANRKLSVLRSVKLLNRKTLDLLYKITVRSVIDYALPVYHKNLKQTDIANNWETIFERGDFLGLNIFHKIHLHETRPLIRKCMPQLDFEKKFETRSKGGYIPFKNYTNKFKTSFFPHISGLWNSLPKQVQCKNLEDFKMYTKKEFKPPKYKHFSGGTKLGNTLLTRIRVGRSFLNEHKFKIGLTDNPVFMPF